MHLHKAARNSSLFTVSLHFAASTAYDVSNNRYYWIQPHSNLDIGAAVQVLKRDRNYTKSGT